MPWRILLNKLITRTDNTCTVSVSTDEEHGHLRPQKNPGGINMRNSEVSCLLLFHIFFEHTWYYSVDLDLMSKSKHTPVV